jgi:hypothetical protein
MDELPDFTETAHCNAYGGFVGEPTVVEARQSVGTKIGKTRSNATNLLLRLRT